MDCFLSNTTIGPGYVFLRLWSAAAGSFRTAFASGLNQRVVLRGSIAGVFAVIFGLLNIINFAHGALYMQVPLSLDAVET